FRARPAASALTAAAPAEAASGDAERLMRTKPADTAFDAPVKEEAVEAEAPVEATGDAERLMRTKPADTAFAAPVEEEAEAVAEEAEAVEEEAEIDEYDEDAEVPDIELNADLKGLKADIAAEVDIREDVKSLVSGDDTAPADRFMRPRPAI
ncbi:MAG: hypothetical protein IJ646_11350, partial [Clostridia bacterium]|nr:hypothetical protein [Clostridia bacterium]